MIESIELRNWKTHKSTTLKFQKGVNVLIGIMGAGKSSVLDAVSFALFGTFPSLSSKKISLTGLITSRPKKEDEAEVILNFTADNDNYRVTRKITEKGSTARLEKNGVYLQAQSTKVTEEIERLLKIDYDTFSRVIYSAQNGLDYFLNLTKVERKREIDHMLGLDSFSIAEENATSLINNMRTAISSIESSISKIDRQELVDSYERLNLERANVEKELAQLKSKEEKEGNELEIAKKRLDELKSKLDEKKRLSEEISKTEGSISRLQEEIKRLGSQRLDLNLLKLELTDAKAHEASLKSDEEKLNGGIIAGERKVAGIESKLNENRRKLKEKESLEALLKELDEASLRKRHDELTDTLSNSMSDIAASSRKIEELNETMRELELAEGRCPVCSRPLDEEHKKMLEAEKKEEIKRLKEAIEKAKESAEKSKRKIQEHEEKLKRIDVAKSRLNDYKDINKSTEELECSRMDELQSLKGLKEHYASLKSELEGFIKRISELDAKLRDAERLERYSKDYESLSARLSEKNKKIKSIDVDEKEVYLKQEEITANSSMLADTRAKISSNLRYAKNIEEQLREKKKLLDNFNEMERSLSNKRSIVENLNKFKLAMIDTEATLRSKLVSSINELMLQLWPRLYPYEDYRMLRLNALKDDYLLELNTSINNEWLQVDGIASGGERSISCLIMRIALAMVVVPNLRWIILDEPTHNIDSSGIAKLIEILGNELPNIVEQVFIITHEDSLKQISLARVYQLDRDKNNSSSTSVVEI